MNFLDKTKLKATEIFAASFEYLSNKYQQSKNIFTPASPFGQILSVVANIGELVFFYIETSISELNFETAKNAESKYGLSRLTGHDATRGISAIGSIQVKIKPGSESEFKGDFIQINNNTRLKCVNNNLEYLVKLEKEYLRIEQNSTELLTLNIIQGELESQTFISNGEPLQSFAVVINDMTDHNEVLVTVNGIKYSVENSLYDMQNGDESCLIKTGIAGGLDIYFGTGSFGKIPPKGSVIEVTYLKTRGSNGNISSNTDVYFEFIDDGIDSTKEEVDLNKILLIRTLNNPSLGSFSENPNFTSIIAPLASKSFVLANPNNYIYFLRKYNYFSHIEVYNTRDDEYLDDDNIVYLLLLPDITKKINSNNDYFTIKTEEFILSEVEKSLIQKTINESGRQVTGTELSFIEPVIMKYSLNIILSYFDNFDTRDINQEIRTILNNYFLKVKRRDRIPRSDIITLIENIKGVDSVSVFFISQKNEEAIRNGFYYTKVYGYDANIKKRVLLENKKINLQPNETPNLGLNDFGDIIIGENEVPIIRGDWYDRNNNYVEEFPKNGTLSSLNIYFKEELPYDIYNKIQQDNLNKIKNEK